MTMTQTEAIKGIRRAAKRRERADKTRREATAELWEYCREAQAAGVSISQIAREAGLSRQGVYDLLGQRPSQRS
jgi:DNA invertase Pin-like site-specific DNA recombinase